MMRTLWLIALAVLGLAPAHADVAQLQQYFAGLKALSADFAQTVYDGHGKVVERASGHMYMERPRRFRWEYRKPYPQLVIADGKQVWLYDKSLQQITVEPLSKALGATPLALLSGSEGLSKVFAIHMLPAQGQLTWYQLRPREAQQQVQALRLGFADGELRVLEMDDALNRRTRIALSHLKRNPDLNPDLFEFTPPPGVDVIGKGQ